MRNLFCLLLLCLVISIPACEKSHRHHHKKHVKIYHLHNGRYCYYDSGLWYWLILSNGSNTSSNYYYTNNSASSASVRPTGYTWSTVKDTENKTQDKFVTPEETEIESLSNQSESIIEEDIVVNERGDIEVDQDGNLVDPDQMSPDNGYGDDSIGDSGIDSSDAGDSGSDSGGGD